MKLCVRCGVKRELSEFHKNKAKKDGLQTQCKVCKKDVNKGYYENTPERNAQRQEWKERQIPVLREYVVSYLQAHPCVDCGEDDLVVLDFDHLRDKKFNISYALCTGVKLERLVEEIAKCEVRCANCHRRITAQRAGWWKTLIR